MGSIFYTNSSFTALSVLLFAVVVNSRAFAQAAFAHPQISTFFSWVTIRDNFLTVSRGAKIDLFDITRKKPVAMSSSRALSGRTVGETILLWWPKHFESVILINRSLNHFNFLRNSCRTNWFRAIQLRYEVKQGWRRKTSSEYLRPFTIFPQTSFKTGTTKGIKNLDDREHRQLRRCRSSPLSGLEVRWWLVGVEQGSNFISSDGRHPRITLEESSVLFRHFCSQTSSRNQR